MTPQETHAAVVSLLQQQGLPLNTANLNRGMLALAQNDMSTDGAVLPAVNASIDRTMGAAQQAASRSETLPTPPVPPTTTMPQPQELVAPAASSELTTLKALQADGPSIEQMAPQANAYNADTAAAAPDMLTMRGIPDANLYDAKTAGQPVTIPREPGYIMSGINKAAKYAQDALTLPTPTREFSLETIGEDIRNGRVPNPNPDLPLILFGTGPISLAGRAYPAMQQFMRQRTMDIMRQNPQRPPSNMLNQAGEGFDEALAARTQAGQRSTYRGEGVDDFIKGGNTPSASASAPASSVKTNTPTWKGESDPSAPMGARSTATPTQSTPAQKQNTATPHTPSQDTSGAGSAIKQSLTKRKQMAASKSTRKSEK